MSKRLSYTQSMVEPVLQRSAAARASDKRLLVELWQAKGMNLSRHQIELFVSLPSPEAITRMRRKLQESGKYLAPIQVAQERADREAETKAFITHGEQLSIYEIP